MVYNSVNGLIMNEKKEILVEDHVKLDSLIMPGGKQDEGEDSIASLGRELYEELDIVIDDIVEMRRRRYENVNYPAGSDTFVVFNHIFYKILTFSGKIKNKEPLKHRSLIWATKEELLKRNDLSYILRDFLTDIL